MKTLTENKAMTPSAMSVAEAGRKGGRTNAERHGPEHFKAIGSAGGRQTAERHGNEHYSKMGKASAEARRRREAAAAAQ